MKLGDHIISIRYRRGLSQRKLASWAGISKISGGFKYPLPGTVILCRLSGRV